MRTLATYRLEGAFRTIRLEIKPVAGLRLRITAAGPVMSAPPGTPASECKRFLDENEQWILRSMQKHEETRHTLPPITQEQIKEFCDRLPDRLRKWEEITGLRASKVSIKNLTSRWGSCNTRTRSLTFNVNLVHYPGECTDYVIVHELCHIIHPNHSPAFWREVEKYFPDWRRVRNILKQK